MSTAIPFSNKAFSVSCPLLLSLYGVIPIAVLVVFFDQATAGGSIREALPQNPVELMFWAILFNFPHIVSSFITLADDEYIPYYKARFWKALKIIIPPVLFINIAVPMFTSPSVANSIYTLLFVFTASYTMFHLLSQQFGIGMMMMKVRPTMLYEVWRWLSTLSASMVYFMVFTKPHLQGVNFGTFTAYEVAFTFAGVLVVLGGLAGIKLTQHSQRQLGTVYVYSNVLMLIAIYCFLAAGYDFFVIAIVRFVHDVTAFIIYSTHDQNRNRKTYHNYIYKALSFIKIPPLLLCPILAVIAANSVECGAYLADVMIGFNFGQGETECFIHDFYTISYENPLPATMKIGLQIMFIGGFFHYYIEGFVWKREAIHRHSVKFV